MKSLTIINPTGDGELTPTHVIYAQNMYLMYHSTNDSKKSFTFKVGSDTIKKIIYCEVHERHTDTIVSVRVEYVEEK